MTTIAEIRTKYPQYHDMSDQDLAKALHSKFYSDMPMEQFSAKIGLTPQPAAPHEQTWLDYGKQAAHNLTPLGMVENAGSQVKQIVTDPMGTLHAADDHARMLANGMSFGLADRAAGYANGTGTEAERAKSHEVEKRLGPQAFVDQAVGSFIPTSKLAAAGVTATRIPGFVGNMLGNTIDGAVLGGATAAGNGEDIKTGVLAGAGGGLAGDIVGGVARKFMSSVPKTMNAEQIRDAAKQSYAKADAAGVVYKPEAVANLSNDIKQQFAQFGYHPDLQPGAKVALGELDRLAEGGNVNLTGLDTARKIASNAYIPGNKSNNALVSKIINGIDDLTKNPDPANVLIGDAVQGASSLAEARQLWGRASKLDTVDELLNKADLRAGSTGSGGNIENATRQNLRSILQNKAKSRGFTVDEKAALERAVMGSPVQNTLRQVGKFSPVGNGLVGTIQGLMAVGTHAAGAPMVAPVIIGGAAAGTAAKYGSEAMQRSAVERLQKLIAAGGDNASIAATLSPAKKKAIEVLSRALMLSGPAALSAAQ